MLQSFRQIAYEAYTKNLNEKDTYNFANRQIYRAMRDMGYFRKSTRIFKKGEWEKRESPQDIK